MNSDNYIEDVQEDPDRHALTLAVHFIIDRTYTVWNERKQPYFVSLINPDLKKIGVDLKKVIFPETVKNFVQNNLLDYVKIVSHPEQRSKIGLIPKTEEFSFTEHKPSISEIQVEKQINALKVSPRDALISFIEALVVLTPEEVDKIIIPTSVLLKMINEK